MADSKITALTSISTSTDPAVDPLVIVDVSDTSMAATGTTKRVTLNNLLSSSPTATGAFTVTGLVTAGSATITGDLTVDTSTLKVDSANDRVGIGTASPAAGAKLGVLGATSVSTSDYIGSSTYAARFIGSSNGASSGISLLTNSAAGQPTPASIHATPIADFRSALTATYSADNTGAGYFAVNRFNPSGSNTLEHYKIDNAGVATWSNVGGVAGTAMTLNATGLGIGATPAERLTIGSTTAANYIKLTNLGAATGLLIGSFNTAVDIKNREVGAINLFTSDTQRMVISATGDVTISTGNVVMGTSGKGIDFSATANSSGTMTSELLNDYEEGTFLPTVIGTTSAGTATYAIQVGIYTKIGRTVQFQLDVSYSAGTGTGNLRVSNLPFTNGGYLYPVNVYPLSIGMTALYYGAAILGNGTSFIDMQQLPTGGGGDLTVPYDAAGRIIITGTYTV